MNPIIKTQNLTFHFHGKQNAVNELNLKVPEGSIYGFLGPNGAGKSTTIRMLAGLLRPASGSIEMFDQSFKKAKSAILRKSAYMIEEPTLYKHLTGRQNIELICKSGGYDAKRIDEVLDWVHLSNDKNRKAGNYSMGMKQRLGIAGALLPDPDLFVLDEPTNGLDPQGMYEIRELIVDLNKRYSKTIFISSHLLGEIEKMCTHVGIIHHGKGIFEGSIQELADVNKSVKLFRIETSQMEKANEVLGKFENLKKVDENTLEVQPKDKAQQYQIITSLVNAGVEITQAYEVKNSLEELFIQVTDN
jgi:ABC-type multidrug transport system ATPase subunit